MDTVRKAIELIQSQINRKPQSVNEFEQWFTSPVQSFSNPKMQQPQLGFSNN